jgi:UDP-glucose 4-epimerase
VDRLSAGPPAGEVLNVGTGRGYSVLEVVADPGRIGHRLGWRAEHDLTDMVASTWLAWSTPAVLG